MNFGEKLIKLRKEAGISQEELGEKLNVTRQTVSKWELGQTKPDMSKLVEISKLFNVGIENLTDDSHVIQSSKRSFDVDEVKPRKWLLIVLIILAIAISGVLVYEVVEGFKNSSKEGSIFDRFFNSFQQSTTEFNKEFDKSKFNNIYEAIYSGEENSSGVVDLLEEIITNNKTNSNHVITVIYKEENTSDVSKINELKGQFDTSDIEDRYDISLDYDKDGYINQITVKKLKISVSDFNFKFTHSSGKKSGFFLENILTNVIDSNKKYPEQIIKVIYNGATYIEENDIKKIKNGLDDFTNYDVSIDYDTEGYVSVITIEKL